MTLLIGGGFLISHSVGVDTARAADTWTTVFSDDFNRADGAVGNGWQVGSTPCQIVGNQCVINSTNAYTQDMIKRTAADEVYLDQKVSVDILGGGSSNVAEAYISARTIGSAGGATGTMSTYGSDLNLGTGKLSFCRVATGSISQVQTITITNFDKTHLYHSEMTVTGANPTTIDLVLTDLTTNTVVATYNTTDNTPALQMAGGASLWAFSSSNTGSTVAFDNFQLQTLNAPVANTVYNVAAADLWDNGYNNTTDVPRSSALSRFVFTTDAASVTLHFTATNSSASLRKIAVRVDGGAPTLIDVTASGDYVLDLGAAGTSRQVEVTLGGQNNSGYGQHNITGVFLDSVAYAADAAFAVVPQPAQDRRVVVYGDSISVGVMASASATTSYIPLLRQAGYSVMSEGWGYRSLWDDNSTAAKQDAMVARLASYAPDAIYIALGTNDASMMNTSFWGAGTAGYDAFGAAYSSLVDKLHAALPDAHIICQSVTTASPAAINAQIRNACSPDKYYTYYLDATGWLVSTDFADSHVHPNDGGYAKIAPQIANLLDALHPTSGFNGQDFHTVGTTEPVVFSVSDDAANPYNLFGRFFSVEVDGATVDPSNYTLSEGSVDISLTDDYLDSLAVGEHTLTAKFYANVVQSGEFTVAAAEDNTTAPGDNSDGKRADKTTPTAPNITEPIIITSPNTGVRF